MAIKIGDVFLVKLDQDNKKYFQYVANDSTQLNSDVIRVFSKQYLLNENPDLEEIIAADVEFYAHVVTKWGVKLKVWEKVGNTKEIGKVEVLFRDTKDYGAKPGEQVLISKRWYVWNLSQDVKYLGALDEAGKKAEIGIVVTPLDILNRMKTGVYDFVYPKIE